MNSEDSSAQIPESKPEQSSEPASHSRAEAKSRKKPFRFPWVSSKLSDKNRRLGNTISVVLLVAIVASVSLVGYNFFEHNSLKSEYQNSKEELSTALGQFQQVELVTARERENELAGYETLSAELDKTKIASLIGKESVEELKTAIEPVAALRATAPGFISQDPEIVVPELDPAQVSKEELAAAVSQLRVSKEELEKLSTQLSERKSSIEPVAAQLKLNYDKLIAAVSEQSAITVKDSKKAKKAQLEKLQSESADLAAVSLEELPAKLSAIQKAAAEVKLFHKFLSNIDNPDSVYVVVNKRRPINPKDWAPDDLVTPKGIPSNGAHQLRKVAAQALEKLHKDLKAAGHYLIITSAYRSYYTQVALFDRYAREASVAEAETYSARASHSEHQLGLAVDVDDNGGCAFESCFGKTATGKWLRDNAHKYGFILRYHDGEEGTVGYIYEPWHFRYIGVEAATDMKNKKIKNLEDYLGLPAAPDYNF